MNIKQSLRGDRKGPTLSMIFCGVGNEDFPFCGDKMGSHSLIGNSLPSLVLHVHLLCNTARRLLSFIQIRRQSSFDFICCNNHHVASRVNMIKRLMTTLGGVSP